jgi:peptidoglycan/LPS O-acetylase OafA/YrhL
MQHGAVRACLVDMDDLRDVRGRLRRLALAALLGLALTVLAMHAIDGSGPPANSDPVGASAVPLLAIGIFVVTTSAIAAGLARLARKS